MVVINTTDDLLRLLDENEEFRTAVRNKILTEELIKMPAEFKEFRDEMKDFTAEMKDFRCEVRESNRVNSGHISDMRGLFASQKVVREAALIADRIGLRTVRTLEAQDIIDIWNAGKAKGLTNNISKDYEDSFKIADLIIEAQTNETLASARAPRYIAVEISYTADERDTARAIRNAEYISKFVEIPTYAVVAGISKDNRIDEVLSDMPEPYDSERETRVFWSKHEDIGKPD